MGTRKRKNRAQAAQPAAAPELREVFERFREGAAQPLARIASLSGQVAELLGRWEDLGDAESGLLGGNLLGVINQTLLDEELAKVKFALARLFENPEEATEQTLSYAILLIEYATLIRRLNDSELKADNPLHHDWRKLSDELWQHAQTIAHLGEMLEEALDIASDEDEEEEGEIDGPGVARELLHRVWRRTQAGEPLQGEEVRLAEVMRQHPEYSAAWDKEPVAGESDFTIEGVNPFLHVTMHVLVENQLDQNDPPETRATMERLMAGGLSRHEALHRIANVAAKEMFGILRDHRPFDHRAFVKGLRAL